MKFNRYYLLLFLILLGCFVVRFYRFNNPIADWHSWRQADTSAVSRNFINNGYDILHPRFEDLSNVPSGLENPQGYRFVEFPIYNILQAGGYQLFGIFSLEEWGRFITILSSVFATLFLFLIIKRYNNIYVALLSAFFYAFFPYDIYYGRTILPDPSMVTATLGAIYFFDLWLHAKSKQKPKSYSLFIISIIFSASALLLKPYAIFFLLPMLIIVYNKWGFGFLKKWQLWVFAIISIIPLFWWRYWMQQYPEGIPASSWLLNGNGIRFHPAFFRWLGYERLTKLISGYTGLLLLLSGIIAILKSPQKLFFSSFAIASVIYICVFATGNVQHDYYQILIMPSIAILYGFGAWYLIQKFKKPFNIGAVAVVLISVSSIYFSWHYVKDYFNINNPSIIVAGEAVDKLTPKNAKVIANYNGDTSFLYQTKRNGWPSYEHDLPTMVKLGADYLAIANPTPSDFEYAKAYKVVAKTKQYAIFNLREKP